MTTQTEYFTKEFESYIISIGKYVPLIDIKIIWNQIINIANNYDIDFDVLKEVITFKSSFTGFLLSLL